MRRSLDKLGMTGAVVIIDSSINWNLYIACNENSCYACQLLIEYSDFIKEKLIAIINLPFIMEV